MITPKEKKVGTKERYNPIDRELYWQDFWNKERIYEFDPEQSGTQFIVDTPPPTISGALHMGHIFSYTQAEVIARFKRMAGFNVRYPQGFDNNGLPTERLTEKELGVRGHNTDLKEFIASCLRITEKYKTIYENLWKSIGLSVDWRLAYSTISPEVQKLAQLVFKEFYEKGLIYKKKAPALYCPECHTSFAQAEKEDKEVDAVFYDLIFKTDTSQDLVISTTRPELLPACAAVFVNSSDKRYKHLIGKKVVTPLGQKVTVLSDDKAEIEKGSGAVMCCTYGDETDIYWAKTYGLKERIILNEYGKLQNVDEVPEINGKTTEIARKIIIDKLKKDGFVKNEKNIRHSIGVHERCGTSIEFLPIVQWFVKMLDMKDKLLAAGNEINWYPSFMQKRYEEWITGLKWDWCISRERFYGIPIPVLNCDDCEEVVILDKDTFPVDPKTQNIKNNCPHCKKGKLIPETNVLDTWFTSALTPDINNDHELNGSLKGKLYPMSVRPMGHDIIRTWAVYSILVGLYRHGQVPWKNLMISGHLLQKKGEKISKKTGGGNFNPEKLIADKSADAVRYAMFGAILGKDATFDEMEVEKGRKLVTKIYNAGKLVLSKIDDFNPAIELPDKELEVFDKWILGRSKETAEKMAKAFESYEYSKARQSFEDFFWLEFCDNYLEIVKHRLSNKNRSAQYTAYHSFLNVLKMASPFVPHITEEMYHAKIVREGSGEDIRESLISQAGQGYFYKNVGIKSIHNTKWASTDNKHIDSNIIKDAQLALDIISEARKIKTAEKIGFGKDISLLHIKYPSSKHKILKPYLDDIKYTMRANKVTLVSGRKIEVSLKV